MHNPIVTPNTELFAPFKGKQLELRNLSQNRLLRGQIAEVEITDEQIRVYFDWLAKNRGGASQRYSHGWETSDELQLVIDLGRATCKQVSQHVFINDPATCDTIVFVGTEHGNIDPRVEGLL
jgi:hypothetical protein